VSILENDELVLFLIVTVGLVVGELGQGDVVGLDDLIHELVVVLGVAIVGGTVEFQRLLDLKDGGLADDCDVGVALEGDVILGGDLGRALAGSLLQLGGGVADVLGSLADDEFGLCGRLLDLGRVLACGPVVESDGDAGQRGCPGLARSPTCRTSSSQPAARRPRPRTASPSQGRGRG
jgi:hypothetical protein